MKQKGGEIMSLDAMMKVTQAEKLGQQRKIEATSTAKKVVADAEQVGIVALSEARHKAEEEVANLMVVAEDNAAKQAKQIMANTQASCDELRKLAESHMEQATVCIVRRVVNS